MPVKPCRQGGKPGFKWGDNGKCYTYTTSNEISRRMAKEKAERQGRAINASRGRVNKSGEYQGIKKVDDEKQIVWGEVYSPDIPDSHGEFMTPHEIELMAYRFMAKGRLDQVDVMHDNKQTGAFIVESFIARKDDPIFIDFSWVVAVHIPDFELWSKIKDGTFNGFSMQALAYKTDREIVLDIPPVIRGKTSEEHNHAHTFEVTFDKEGNLVGGRTSEENGHYHEIRKGVVTEEADGHTHRFSYVEELDVEG